MMNVYISDISGQNKKQKNHPVSGAIGTALNKY